MRVRPPGRRPAARRPVVPEGARRPSQSVGAAHTSCPWVAPEMEPGPTLPAPPFASPSRPPPWHRPPGLDSRPGPRFAATAAAGEASHFSAGAAHTSCPWVAPQMECLKFVKCKVSSVTISALGAFRSTDPRGRGPPPAHVRQRMVTAWGAITPGPAVLPVAAPSLGSLAGSSRMGAPAGLLSVGVQPRRPLIGSRAPSPTHGHAALKHHCWMRAMRARVRFHLRVGAGRFQVFFSPPVVIVAYCEQYRRPFY
jgi:hypothetical protein